MCLLELSTMEYPYAECKNAAQIYRKVSLVSAKRERERVQSESWAASQPASQPIGKAAFEGKSCLLLLTSACRPPRRAPLPSCLQGVRPAGLQKVASPQLAEFINLCISPRDARPRARQLLKHSFFDSIRRDKMLVSSRSDAALAGGGVGSGTGGDGGSDYGGSMTSGGPVSRTASSLNDLMAAVVVSSGPLSDRGERERGGALLQQHVAQHTAQQLAAAGAANIAAALQGLPSASSSAALLGGGASGSSHPLSRTVSAEAVHSDRAHSDRAHSDSASVRSQRSNASELALAHMLEDIAEGEGEGDTTGGWARRPVLRGWKSSSKAATCLPANSRREQASCLGWFLTCSARLSAPLQTMGRTLWQQPAVAVLARAAQGLAAARPPARAPPWARPSSPPPAAPASPAAPPAVTAAAAMPPSGASWSRAAGWMGINASSCACASASPQASHQQSRC
jgi:hypothetical protein